MTNQQIAEQILRVISNTEYHNTAWALKEVLEELRKLISGEDFTYDWGNMEHTTWDDCLKQIDAVCDELDNL